MSTVVADSNAAPTSHPLTSRLLTRQVIEYAPGVLVPAVMSLVFAMVFTRLFDSAEYGKYSLGMSAASLLMLVTSQWLVQGTNRFLPGVAGTAEAGRLKTAIGVGLLAMLSLACVVSLVFIGTVALTARAAWMGVAIAAGAVALTSCATLALTTVLQAEMKAKRYTAYGVASSVARLVFALALVLLIARHASLLLWGQAAAGAVLIPLLWRDGGFPPIRHMLNARRGAWTEIRRMAVYGLPVMGWTIAATLLDTSDRWLIEFFRGSAEVGVYAANYSLVASSVGLMATPMLLATHPFLMRAWGDGDRASTGKWLGMIVEWYIVAGAVLVGIVGIYSKDIATLLLGPEFRVGHQIIPVVIAGMVAWQLGMYSHKPLEFTERTRLMFGLCIGAAALNVVLNMLFLPRFGYVAAAYTTLISFVFYASIATWVGRQMLPWRIRWRVVLPAGAMCIIGFGLTVLVRSAMQPAFGFTIAFIASALVALATAAVVLGRQIAPLLAARRARAA